MNETIKKNADNSDKLGELVSCQECEHFKTYLTGDDEYPQRTYIADCKLGHFENADPRDDTKIKCSDFNATNATSETE